MSPDKSVNNNEYEFYTSDEYAPAPTVAPRDPTLNTDESGVVAPEAAAPAEGSSIGALTGNKGLDILLISLSVVGAVAVLGLAALGVKQLAKKKDTSGEAQPEKEDSDGDN